MSRVTEHRNGLQLVSGGMFYVTDEFAPEGVSDIRDGYTCLVSTHSYIFEHHSTFNAFVLTPAQQIVWRTKVERVTVSMGGRDYPMDSYFTFLSSWARHWLLNNVGEQYDFWDTYTKAEGRRSTVFFKRRRDALAFIRVINENLTGMRFSEF